MKLSLTPATVRPSPNLPSKVGLYIHIPFCRSKCAYCDFPSVAGQEHLIPRYVEAVLQELRRTPQVGAATIYFGGGTPSLLSPAQVARLVEACYQSFTIPTPPEITLEANPGTLSLPQLQDFRRAGVNRLSLGVQSFHDGELRLLQRIHTAEQARSAFLLAREAGYDNINLDLIYGLPSQTLSAWRETLHQALSLCPDHLSLYCLTLEEDTPLGRAVARGEIPAPDPDLGAEMYLYAEEALEEAGWEHYELSNWARPGRACRHNLIYWRREPYLSFGAAAHSCFDHYRYANIASPLEYVRRMEAGESPVDFRELISPELERAEAIILGLRLVAGVDGGEFERRFGVPLLSLYGEQIRELRELGLLEIVGPQSIRLTPRGRLLGNEAFWRFLPRP